VKLAPSFNDIDSIREPALLRDEMENRSLSLALAAPACREIAPPPLPIPTRVSITRVLP